MFVVDNAGSHVVQEVLEAPRCGGYARFDVREEQCRIVGRPLVYRVTHVHIRVRNRFVTATRRTDVAAPTALWYAYGDFNADMYDRLKALEFSDDDINELPVHEYLEYANRRLEARAA